MASEPILVDEVRDIAPERPGRAARGKARGPALRVRFSSGAEARLDPENPRDRVWAEVLESLRDSRQPAYVEIDPATRFITSLLLPEKFTVTALRKMPGTDDVEVELEISHARHHLRRAHPRFDEMQRLLERARREKVPVLVTESLDSSEIVDVRLAPGAPARRRG